MTAKAVIKLDKGGTMSKKEKMVLALAEDFKAMIAMVPKLEIFIKAHKEIAEGYQKYRKNGGVAISGIEKHLGVKEIKSSSPLKNKKPAKTTEEVKSPKAGSATKKIKTKEK